jgi:hypothetical protein
MPGLYLVGDYADICENNERIFESTLAHFTPEIIYIYIDLHKFTYGKTKEITGNL